MEASLLDLRTNMKKVMAALDRGEHVVLCCCRRKIARIVPFKQRGAKTVDQKAFGMWADRDDMASVENYVRDMRKSQILYKGKV